MYKAIFIDIDKTLLNSKSELTEENKRAIDNVKKHGIKTIIISGRSRVSASNFKECSSGYLISSNGADIYDFENNEILFQSVIEENICKKLYDFSEENDMVIKLDFGLSRAVNKKDYLEDYEIEIDNIDKFLSQNSVIQIAICAEDINKIDIVKKYINEQTNLKVSNQFIWNVNDKIMNAIHITNSCVSKGNAMNGLCKYLKIDLKDVVAIGDKTNDISMIEMAGLGVAMGNAIDEAKNVADYITTSNDENGVANVLDKILIEEI